MEPRDGVSRAHFFLQMPCEYPRFFSRRHTFNLLALGIVHKITQCRPPALVLYGCCGFQYPSGIPLFIADAKFL
jgi:uncharacterized membrane protein YeiB